VGCCSSLAKPVGHVLSLAGVERAKGEYHVSGRSGTVLALISAVLLRGGGVARRYRCVMSSAACLGVVRNLRATLLGYEIWRDSTQYMSTD